MNSRSTFTRIALVCAALGTLAPAAHADDGVCYANFLFVLDRSCSMNKPLMTGQTTSKWEYASAAINKLTAAGAGQASFGLAMFPQPPASGEDMSGQACTVTGPVEVPVGSDTANAISSAMLAHAPGAPCTTPMVPGLMQAATESHFATPYASGPRSYAILITDGKPTCAEQSPDVAAAVTTLYERGYPTYVVGFGGAVDPALLDAAALAGGVPRTSFVDDAGVPYDAGSTSYYQADDPDQLDATLESILDRLIGEFSSCQGVPCPDGRCFVAGQTCTAGFCQSPVVGMETGGVLADASANVDAGGGVPAAKDKGCGCSVGGRPTSLPIAGLLALAALVLVRRRRHGRATARASSRGSALRGPASRRSAPPRDCPPTP